MKFRGGARGCAYYKLCLGPASGETLTLKHSCIALHDSNLKQMPCHTPPLGFKALHSSLPLSAQTALERGISMSAFVRKLNTLNISSKIDFRFASEQKQHVHLEHRHKRLAC